VGLRPLPGDQLAELAGDGRVHVEAAGVVQAAGGECAGLLTLAADHGHRVRGAEVDREVHAAMYLGRFG
jgi:hypothetical protein